MQSILSLEDAINSLVRSQVSSSDIATQWALNKGLISNSFLNNGFKIDIFKKGF